MVVPAVVASKTVARGGWNELLKWLTCADFPLLLRRSCCCSSPELEKNVGWWLETPAEEELLMWWVTRIEGRLWFFRERGRRRGERRLPATAIAG